MSFRRCRLDVARNVHPNGEASAFEIEVDVAARDGHGAGGIRRSVVVDAGTRKFDCEVLNSVRDAPGRTGALDADNVRLSRLVAGDDRPAQRNVSGIVEGKRTVGVNDGDAEGTLGFNQNVARIVEYDGALFLDGQGLRCVVLREIADDDVAAVKNGFASG